jgi:DNA-directed RNA polymerase specialized sigma24 family protein/GTPase SAR1 family protein
MLLEEGASLVQLVGRADDGEPVTVATYILTYDALKSERWEPELPSGDVLSVSFEYREDETVRAVFEKKADSLQRVDFSKIKTSESTPMPNLIEVQKKSYARFLQMDPLLTSEAFNTEALNTDRPLLINGLGGAGASFVKALASAVSMSAMAERLLVFLGREKNDSHEEKRPEPFRIAVVGRFSAGKTTFINALLGNSIIPTVDVNASVDLGTTTSAILMGLHVTLVDTPGIGGCDSIDTAVTTKRVNSFDGCRIEKGSSRRDTSHPPDASVIVVDGSFSEAPNIERELSLLMRLGCSTNKIAAVVTKADLIGRTRAQEIADNVRGALVYFAGHGVSEAVSLTEAQRGDEAEQSTLRKVIEATASSHVVKVDTFKARSFERGSIINFELRRILRNAINGGATNDLDHERSKKREGEDLKPDMKLEDLWSAHASTIHQYFRARRFTESDSCDLVQETFLRVWERREAFPTEPYLLVPWLYGIARTVAKHALRRESLEVQHCYGRLRALMLTEGHAFEEFAQKATARKLSLEPIPRLIEEDLRLSRKWGVSASMAAILDAAVLRVFQAHHFSSPLRGVIVGALIVSSVVTGISFCYWWKLSWSRRLFRKYHGARRAIEELMTGAVLRNAAKEEVRQECSDWRSVSLARRFSSMMWGGKVPLSTGTVANAGDMDELVSLMSHIEVGGISDGRAREVARAITIARPIRSAAQLGKILEEALDTYQ